MKTKLLFQLTRTFTIEKVKDILADIVKSVLRRRIILDLDRGFATIPLPGIDTRVIFGLASCLSGPVSAF